MYVLAGIALLVIVSSVFVLVMFAVWVLRIKQQQIQQQVARCYHSMGTASYLADNHTHGIAYPGSGEQFSKQETEQAFRRWVGKVNPPSVPSIEDNADLTLIRTLDGTVVRTISGPPEAKESVILPKGMTIQNLSEDELPNSRRKAGPRA